MEQYLLQVSYKNDRTVNMEAVSLSDAIQYGLKMLGPYEGQIVIKKLVTSAGVPRVCKSVVVTTIVQNHEESVEDYDLLLSALLDELKTRFKDRSSWTVYDTYQRIGELLHNAKLPEQG